MEILRFRAKWYRVQWHGWAKPGDGALTEGIAAESRVSGAWVALLATADPAIEAFARSNPPTRRGRGGSVDLAPEISCREWGGL